MTLFLWHQLKMNQNEVCVIILSLDTFFNSLNVFFFNNIAKQFIWQQKKLLWSTLKPLNCQERDKNAILDCSKHKSLVKICITVSEITSWCNSFPFSPPTKPANCTHVCVCVRAIATGANFVAPLVWPPLALRDCGFSPTPSANWAVCFAK